MRLHKTFSDKVKNRNDGGDLTVCSGDFDPAILGGGDDGECGFGNGGGFADMFDEGGAPKLATFVAESSQIGQHTPSGNSCVLPKCGTRHNQAWRKACLGILAISSPAIPDDVQKQINEQPYPPLKSLEHQSRRVAPYNFSTLTFA